jgi:hypothetical protein
MKDQDGQETTLRYLFNKPVRALATWITGLITVRSNLFGKREKQRVENA